MGMAYNSYDLQNTSLVKTGNLTEMYIPLWYMSSSNSHVASTTPYLIQKGSTNNNATSSIVSSNNLHALSANWSSSQKFCFEASIYIGTSSNSAIAELWDITSNVAVSSSQISTTSTTFTVIRSGSFTLTPGHTYGIGIYTASSGTTVYLSKASLIAFLS